MESIRLFFAGDFCSKPSTSLIKVSDDLKALINSCDGKIINFEVPLKPDTILPSVNYEVKEAYDYELYEGNICYLYLPIK